MSWVEIKKVEKSIYNNSKIIYFDFEEREETSIISDNVLKYLRIDNIEDFTHVFILKSYNNQKKPIYLVKKVKNE